MRNVSKAEWILSLVLPRDRAAAIAGDLAESPSAQGAARFWFSVLGIFAGGLGGGLRAAPMRSGLVVLAALPLAILSGNVSVYSAQSFLSGPDKARFYLLVLGSVLLLTQYALGWCVARFARTGPLAACLIVAAVEGLFGLASFGVSVGDLHPAFHLTLRFWWVLLIPGIVQARRRAQGVAHV